MTSPIPFITVRIQIPESASSAHARPRGLGRTVDRVFITAILLTASAERAEAAILESTRANDLDSMSDEALVREAVNAAINAQGEISAPTLRDLERASSMLPFELRRVLHLKQPLRHCFVLRFLVGLPRESCARLLHLDMSQVDERARAAMLQLPTIQRYGAC